MKKFIALITSILLTACHSTIDQSNNISTSTTEKFTLKTEIPVAGGVETLYVPYITMPFQARMDTGAETSSIDAQNIKPFERDGEKWVSFDIINRKNGETKHFEKPIKRKTNIVRTGEKERRYVVLLDIKMGHDAINAEFTLNDRSKFDYQVLIGRNIINGRFIIDPTLENTMH